jgi:hypothetical protein
MRERERIVNPPILRTELGNGRVVATVQPLFTHLSTPFESLVFGSRDDGFGVLDYRRHRTEAEARAGHAELTQRWGPRT